VWSIFASKAVGDPGNISGLLEQAENPGPADRAAPIEALHELNAPPSAEWEAAWLEEREDRIAAIDRGEMKTCDFDEVMAEARARLKRV
jgi:hypothetical protein